MKDFSHDYLRTNSNQLYYVVFVREERGMFKKTWNVRERDGEREIKCMRERERERES